MREFKVVSKHNKFFGQEGILIRENECGITLKIDNGDYDSFIIFDESEVEEIKY